jgi:hypothetical protein
MRHVVSALVLLSLVAACGYQNDEASSSDAASPEAGAPAVSTEADMQAIAAVRDLEVAAFTTGGDFSYLASDAVPSGRISSRSTASTTRRARSSSRGIGRSSATLPR